MRTGKAMTENQEYWLRVFTWVLSFFVFGIWTIILNVHLRSTATAWVEPVASGYAYSPTLVKTISFGQVPAVIDWIWLSILQDPSIHKERTPRQSKLFYQLDLITDLDPVNFDAYLWGSNLLGIVRDDALGAKDILEKGVRFRNDELSNYPPHVRNRFWDPEWALPLSLGYTYWYELSDIQLGAKYLSEASLLPGAPNYLHRLRKRLETINGQYEAGIRVLTGLLQSAKDPVIRKRLEDRRLALFVGQYLYEVNHLFREGLKRLPSYRKLAEIPRAEIEQRWNSFRKTLKLGSKDPAGGNLFINEAGEIDTTTEQKTVIRQNLVVRPIAGDSKTESQ